ncbi:Gfo/Idh/MocA family oxidoreductase [Paenibacillus sp. Marseille-Q4541]|uniref:Gfo/Idh/MocA family protein n=1 Tax=Paenibacillus sp. Marseille-Q4541 TaxID=2831522 RepID=UPI001BAAC6D3|nr:Gfo/Idh/MocA family oxidoreductase [Paenibacillus sp. Marseille-Q4541]
MDNNHIRFLMIGVGGMGREHIRKLLAIPNVQIAALADPSTASLHQAEEDFPELAGARKYTDYKEALQDGGLDAAVIVSPHRLHFEQGMDCLQAGLHVLMEKPFVDGADNAEQIIRQAEASGKHLAVSYQRHLLGPYMYMQEAVRSGKLGKMQFVSAYQSQSWLTDQKGTWRQSLALSCGGQLNDSGSHLLDVVLWITGMTPQKVSAVMDTRGTEVDIDSAVTIQFEEGAIASFHVVGSASIKWQEDLSIHGEKGTLLYRNGKLYEAYEGDPSVKEVAEERWPASTDSDQNFVDLLTGRIQEAAAPAASGLSIARVTEAAMVSAAGNGILTPIG